MDYQRKRLQIIRSGLVNENFELADTYDELSVCFKNLLEYDSAIYYNLEGLKIKLQLFGKQSIHVANSYNALGIIHHELGNFDLSILNQKNALKINLALLDKNHQQLMINYNNLSLGYSAKG